MRICIYSPYHVSAYTGGNERYCDGIASTLANAGETVVYAAGLMMTDAQSEYGYMLQRMRTPLLYFVIDIWGILEDIDVVHTSGSGWRHLLFACVARVRGVSLRVHSFLAPSKPASILRRLLSLLEAPLIERIYTHILTINTRDQALFPRHLVDQTCHYIAPMLSPEREVIFDIAKQASMNFDTASLVFVGAMDRHHYYKGLRELISALARWDKSWKLTIVGTGEQQPAYEDLVSQLALVPNVTFAGAMSDSKLSRLLATDAILILPSSSISEGFGIVVVEALLCGARVVTTRHAGIAPMLDTRVDIAPDSSEHSLLTAIESALTRSTSSEAKVARRELGLSFSSPVMIPRLLRFYASLKGES